MELLGRLNLGDIDLRYPSHDARLMNTDKLRAGATTINMVIGLLSRLPRHAQGGEPPPFDWVSRVLSIRGPPGAPRMPGVSRVSPSSHHSVTTTGRPVASDVCAASASAARMSAWVGPAADRSGVADGVVEAVPLPAQVTLICIGV